MDDSDLTRLEERLAHQEHAVNELSDVLHRQQQRLDRLEALCRQLGDRLATLQQGGAVDPTDEKPPHY
ncbi:MAG: SlyX family protein [Gammaproteobacteria bacterium]|nr:SlyX family protein [Gammaproteobacteria bacterium]